MLMLSLFIAMITLGSAIGRWWTVSLPILLGAVLTVVVAMSGDLRDNPVVFTVVLAEFGTVVGVVVRRHFAPV